MVFDGMPDAYLSFDMSVSFRPESPDGLILYNGLTKETRDFMSLALIGGVPEFRYITYNTSTTHWCTNKLKKLKIR